MAESVDALVSNTSGFTSIPVRPRVWVHEGESFKTFSFFYMFLREWPMKLVRESVYLNLFTIVVKSDRFSGKLNLSSYIKQKNVTRNGTLKSTMNP